MESDRHYVCWQKDRGCTDQRVEGRRFCRRQSSSKEMGEEKEARDRQKGEAASRGHNIQLHHKGKAETLPGTEIEDENIDIRSKG